MHRRQFLGGVGVGIALISGCLGGDADVTTPVPASNQAEGGSTTQTATPAPATEAMPESTPETGAESTPESTPDSPEDRIDFTPDADDPDVVGTLLTKGPVPGVVVSSELPFASAWQNYATVDEDAGIYRVGLSVTTQSSIGRLSVTGTVFGEDGAVLAADTDVSNNIPGGEKALIHLAFEGDIEEMHHFEVALDAPK